MPGGRSFWSDYYTPVLWAKYAICVLRFLFGWFLILTVDQVAFGAGTWGTAAASAVVYYTLFIPYVAILSFFVVGRDGVPPAYRLFQFFITQSGSRKIWSSLGNQGARFDARGYQRTVRGERTDKYQARMETEELRKAAEAARADAERMREEAARHAEEETKRTEAAEEAARAAEEVYRARARKRAWEKRRRRE